MGPWLGSGGQVRDKKRGSCLHTRYIFLHTLVHTPRYSTCKNICYSHTRLLPGAPESQRWRWWAWVSRGAFVKYTL